MADAAAGVKSGGMVRLLSGAAEKSKPKQMIKPSELFSQVLSK